MPGAFSGGWNPYPGWMGHNNQGVMNIVARTDRRPQEALPADPDPERFYVVKELDGAITHRNRFTIENCLHPYRWVQDYDGSFYVQRLPDSDQLRT